MMPCPMGVQYLRVDVNRQVLSDMAISEGLFGFPETAMDGYSRISIPFTVERAVRFR
jgi:hypothetical protein